MAWNTARLLRTGRTVSPSVAGVAGAMTPTQPGYSTIGTAPRLPPTQPDGGYSNYNYNFGSGITVPQQGSQSSQAIAAFTSPPRDTPQMPGGPPPPQAAAPPPVAPQQTPQQSQPAVPTAPVDPWLPTGSQEPTPMGVNPAATPTPSTGYTVPGIIMPGQPGFIDYGQPGAPPMPGGPAQAGPGSPGWWGSVRDNVRAHDPNATIPSWLGG